MSSVSQKTSVADELAKAESDALEILHPAPPPSETPRRAEHLWLRVLTFIRPEEYLLLAIGLVFAYLHHAEMTKVVFKTTFIQAGWQLFIGFIQVFTVVAAWRGYRRAIGESTKPSNALIGTVVLLPIVVVGLFTAGVLKIKWEAHYLDRGWYLVAALVLGGSVFTARAIPSGERAKAISSFALFMAKDVVNFARDWLPFIALLSTYENALRLIGRVRSSLYDPEMFRLDEIIFRGHLDVWFQRIVSAKLTEAFAFFYNGLYLFPIVVGMTLYLQWRHREFRSFLLAFVVAGWVGYLGYLLVPVIGPRYFYPELYSVPLYASKVSASMRDAAIQSASEAGMRFLALAEQVSDRAAYGGQYPRNCFPSLHTAWGVVVLICSYRYTRPLFYILVIPLLWMIAATSYLRFHYLVDVLAGVLLAIMMVAMMPRIDHFWARLYARARGLPEPPSITKPAESSWDKARLWFALGSYGVFAAFVVAYVVHSDISREKVALAEAIIREDAGGVLPELSADQSIGAHFGGSIELVGINGREERSGQQRLLHLDLYFRAIAKTEGNWKIFVHLRDSRGRNIMNADHHPVGGAYRIKAWKPGDIVKDTITLRIPRGSRGSQVGLWVGLFDEYRVNDRLPITTAPPSHPTEANAVKVLGIRLD